MRSRGGLFWQSLLLTLLILLPMIGAVSYFSAQRTQQEQLKEASVKRSGVAVEAGAQNTLRLLVAIQKETPDFLLVRFDSPAHAVTLCGVPGAAVVKAPSGETTLGECYMTAGPARALQLISDTLGYAPDHYFAAVPDTFVDLAGEDTAIRFDTAAVLSKAERTVLGYDSDSIAQLKAGTVEEFLKKTSANLSAGEATKLRAAVWAAFLRQNPELLAALPQAMRDASSRTLTDLSAQELYTLQDTVTYLSGQTSLDVEYDVLPGVWDAGAQTYTLDEATPETACRLLG